MIQTLVPIHLCCLLLAAVLTGCAPSEDRGPASDGPAGAAPQAGARSGEAARLAAIAERVTIIRDDFGVPHVYARTDADAVFGMLYAQAEDDFPRIERNYVWAIGRLAEVEGEAALWSDLRARLYMTRAEAEAAYEQAPPWLRALCDAFADGLNWYLMTHPETQPALLERFEPWMPFYFFEGSIGGDIERIDTDGIAAFYGQGRAVEATVPPLGAGVPAGADPAADMGYGSAGTVAPSPGKGVASASGPAAGRDPDRETRATWRFREPVGSNGFAIAPERTADGNTLLLINPHTSFFFRGEVHVVSEEGLNAYGAVTWGQFFVYQGFNEDTGWMHTSTRVDFMDEFVEDVRRDGERLVYRYGDEVRPVEVREVTLAYRDGGELSQRTFPLYRTHHGPVTHAIDGAWTVTRINWDPVNALRQSYLRMKNADYEAFREMMTIRTNSSNNTVYADSSGNIAYFHGNFVPKRDPELDWSRPVDGSDPAQDWLGLHTVEETITLLNPESGWIQNANSTPFTAAGASSPERADYPTYMAPDPENHRGIHAVRVLTGGRDLTLDGLIDLAYDPQLPGFEALVPGLVRAFDEQPGWDPELGSAIDVLRDWDLRVRPDSVAMTLAHFYGVNMIETVESPEGLSRMERIDWLGTDSEPERRLAVFAETLAELEGKFGTWETPWIEVTRFQRLDGAIEPRFDDEAPSIGVGTMASGRWGALASFGAPRREDVDRLYGRYGNSFVAVVEFGDRVRAKTLLAGGQSNDPASPHFDDQAQRYADVAFKEAAYYREDVEARAARTYHPGL